MHLEIAQKLTRFSLKSQHCISSIEPIFIYAAREYPQLRYLEIKSVSATFNKTGLEKEEELDVGASLLNQYSTYASFVRKCPNVNTLELGNILPDHVLLEAISTMGIQLKQLNIESFYGISRSTCNFIMRTIQQAIASITLHSLLRARNATQILISALASCQKLTYLDLGRQLDSLVNLLLDQYPQLISLSL